MAGPLRLAGPAGSPAARRRRNKSPHRDATPLTLIQPSPQSYTPPHDDCTQMVLPKAQVEEGPELTLVRAQLALADAQVVDVDKSCKQVRAGALCVLCVLC